MNFYEISDEWIKDSVIDDNNIQNEITNIPILHAKYLKELNLHKLLSTKNMHDYNRMRNIKMEYYSGNLDKETLDKYGWDQFELKIGNKANLERYLDSDEELINLLMKKEQQDLAASSCKYILEELKNRTWQLKNIIDWNKFQAGA